VAGGIRAYRYEVAQIERVGRLFQGRLTGPRSTACADEAVLLCSSRTVERFFHICPRDRAYRWPRCQWPPAPDLQFTRCYRVVWLHAALPWLAALGSVARIR
jgi:hypothetical protein